jgi:hypothetical protein
MEILLHTSQDGTANHQCDPGSGANQVHSGKPVPMRNRRWPMLFIVSWSISPDNRNATIERFLKTGGAHPQASP